MLSRALASSSVVVLAFALTFLPGLGAAAHERRHSPLVVTAF